MSNDWPCFPRGAQELHRGAAPDWFKPVNHNELSAYFDEFLLTDNAYVFVSEADGQLNGYVLARVYQLPDTVLTYGGTIVELDQLTVDLNHRRRGIGTSLIERVKELATDVGAHRVQLTVWEFNQSAQSVFQRIGFWTAMRRLIMGG